MGVSIVRWCLSQNMFETYLGKRKNIILLCCLGLCIDSLREALRQVSARSQQEITSSSSERCAKPNQSAWLLHVHGRFLILLSRAGNRPFEPLALSICLLLRVVPALLVRFFFSNCELMAHVSFSRQGQNFRMLCLKVHLSVDPSFISLSQD